MNGTPVIDFQTDLGALSASMTPIYFGTTRVMRVDITLRNPGNDVFDFDPGKDIKLQVLDGSSIGPLLTPVAPYRLRNRVKADAAAMSLATLLVGAFASAAYSSAGDQVSANITAQQAVYDAQEIEILSDHYARMLTNTMLKQ